MLRLLRRSTLVVALFALLAVGVFACAPPPPAGQPSSMLLQVNAQRRNAGAVALVWCPSLGRAAAAHSADQAAHNLMPHTGSDGSDNVVRDERNGYLNWTALGENVAAGYPSEAAVLTAWMASPGHRANILNPAFTHMGSEVVTAANGTPYWTQDFGRGGTC